MNRLFFNLVFKAGKHVGIIGNGASAVQILPELIKRSAAKKVVMFQRTAHYCFPRFQYTYRKDQKKILKLFHSCKLCENYLIV